MKTYLKQIILFFIAVLILVLIILSVYLKRVSDYKQAVKATSFNEIDISSLSDGVYIGEYDVDFIYAKVEVTVQGGKIICIDILEHKQERGIAAEAIIDDIIREQKTDVDAISGATNSSVVIKKAVENALKSGVN